MKKLMSVQGNDRGHWVGDGFPVRTLFFYQDLGKEMSPFLMLDFAGPMQFPATTERKGVGSHPHRGFETVTFVYEGEVEHKDSTGQGGVIGPGEVQWMTAGAGILHEEFHSTAFARAGGVLQMIQLWVNLPAQDKMTSPGYQPILRQQIPELALADGSGTARVIAGSFGGEMGTHVYADAGRRLEIEKRRRAHDPGASGLERRAGCVAWCSSSARRRCCDGCADADV